MLRGATRESHGGILVHAAWLPLIALFFGIIPKCGRAQQATSVPPSGGTLVGIESGGAEGSVVEAEGTPDCFVSQLAGVHVEAARQSWVIRDGLPPAVIGERPHVRQGGVGQRER